MLKPIGIIGAGGWGVAWLGCWLIREKSHALVPRGGKFSRASGEERESNLSSGYRPAVEHQIYSLHQAVINKSLIICVVPSHTVRGVIASAASHVSSEATVLCGTRGLKKFRKLWEKS